jgi:hypothetical protein
MDDAENRAWGLLRIGEAAPYLSDEQRKDVESGVYNWAIAFARRYNVTRAWTDPVFKDCYVHRVRHVTCNLDGASYVGNTRLRERLESGEVRPADLAALRPDEMFPEAWRAEAAAVALREQKALKPKVMPKTDRYRCAKCKMNDCSFYEMQIRSGDEGSTIFVHCNNCGHGWRIN